MPDELKYRCHQCRKPDPATNKEAVERLREWVEKGEAWAQRMMAQWYRDGKYGLKQSYVMAAMLFEKAVAQGNPGAMHDLACLYYKGQGVAQSFQKAAELYTMAVEQGYFDAMIVLGVMYIKSQGVAQSNELARELFTKAANEGHENAVKALKMLDEQEAKAANELYAMTLEQGQVHEMYNLGNMFLEGQGVAESFKKAAELFTMAAEQGNVDAMTNLGVLYIQGQGVAQSNDLAREWWTKAANEGNELAIENLKILNEDEGRSTSMTPTTTASSPPSVCCSSCDKPQPSGQTFRKCMGCRTVQYCNKECQRAHWSPGGHKQECKRLRKKKEEKKGGSSSQNKTSKST